MSLQSKGTVWFWFGNSDDIGKHGKVVDASYGRIAS